MPERMHHDQFSVAHRLRRASFRAAWKSLCAVTPVRSHEVRCALLRRFGAQIGRNCSVYPGARVWAPWNLVMHDDSCLADGVDCYSVDTITLAAHVVVSQRAFLCTASHDVTDARFKLVTSPIVLEERSWVAAEAFVAPGVTMKEGSVAAARAVVTKDVPAWTIVGGNPAREIGKREYDSE